MRKILAINEAITLSERLRSQKKQIVLAGGCFDILHIGHIRFLEQAKKEGDILMILLEDDRKISERKGLSRPINTQLDRANVLAALLMIDYVVMLPFMRDDTAYRHLVSSLKPAIIAMTEHDTYSKQKEQFAKQTGGKTKVVISRIENQSTTRLAKAIKDKLL